MTALILSNEELNDIFKIVKSLKDPSLLLKGVSETTEIEAKKPRIFRYASSPVRCWFNGKFISR